MRNYQKMSENAYEEAEHRVDVLASKAERWENVHAWFCDDSPFVDDHIELEKRIAAKLTEIESEIDDCNWFLNHYSGPEEYAYELEMDDKYPDR